MPCSHSPAAATRRASSGSTRCAPSRTGAAAAPPSATSSISRSPRRRCGHSTSGSRAHSWPSAMRASRAAGSTGGSPGASARWRRREVRDRVAPAVCPLAWIGLNPRPTFAPFWRDTCCVWARGISMSGDALSDVLRAVRLTGAVFFTVDVAPPWATPVPGAATLAPLILPSAQHLISYHLVTSGSWWAIPAGGAPVRLEAGDVIVFPGGVPHVMCSDPKTPLNIGFDIKLVGPVEQWPYRIFGEPEGDERLG